MKKLYIKPFVEMLSSTVEPCMEVTSIQNGNDPSHPTTDIDDNTIQVGAKDWNGWDD